MLYSNDEREKIEQRLQVLADLISDNSAAYEIILHMVVKEHKYTLPFEIQYKNHADYNAMHSVLESVEIGRVFKQNGLLLACYPHHPVEEVIKRLDKAIHEKQILRLMQLCSQYVNDKDISMSDIVIKTENYTKIHAGTGRTYTIDDAEKILTAMQEALEGNVSEIHNVSLNAIIFTVTNNNTTEHLNKAIRYVKNEIALKKQGTTREWTEKQPSPEEKEEAVKNFLKDIFGTSAQMESHPATDNKAAFISITSQDIETIDNGMDKLSRFIEDTKISIHEKAGVYGVNIAATTQALWAHIDRIQTLTKDSDFVGTIRARRGVASVHKM